MWCERREHLLKEYRKAMAKLRVWIPYAIFASWRAARVRFTSASLSSTISTSIGC